MKRSAPFVVAFLGACVESMADLPWAPRLRAGLQADPSTADRDGRNRPDVERDFPQYRPPDFAFPGDEDSEPRPESLQDLPRPPSWVWPSWPRYYLYPNPYGPFANPPPPGKEY